MALNLSAQYYWNARFLTTEKDPKLFIKTDFNLTFHVLVF